MSDVYREKVGSLCLALESEETRTGARDAIRALIEAIMLEPDGDQLKIRLKGDLAAMLSAARDSKRSPDTGDLMVQIKLVAGAGNQPPHRCIAFAVLVRSFVLKDTTTDPRQGTRTHACNPRGRTPRAHSQRNTLAETAMKKTNSSASIPTSEPWASQPSPRHTPRRSETA
jgi:hypothetical protein